MKKFLLLVMVAVIASYQMAGCVTMAETYTDSGQAINIGVKQEFIVGLGSNPTTGYGWEESHDDTILELVKKTYEPGKEAEEGVVGAGGVDFFQFKALKTGETKITLSYKRPGEEEVVEQKIFTVTIE